MQKIFRLEVRNECECILDCVRRLVETSGSVEKINNLFNLEPILDTVSKGMLKFVSLYKFVILRICLIFSPLFFCFTAYEVFFFHPSNNFHTLLVITFVFSVVVLLCIVQSIQFIHAYTFFSWVSF